MVKSPNKVITSGTAPTTTNTSKGDLAFGTVNGETKLYGNTGTEVVELGGGGGSEVNVITPLKVNTAPTTDADTVVNVAVGEQATATIGDLSGLSEENRTAMEAVVAEMGGAGNTSIGCQATATGLSCTAIGYGAVAGSNLYDNTVGGDPLRGGYVSIALGPVAIASETGSIAIGSATESKSPFAIAIGHTAKAKSDDVNNGPVAIGLKASATGASSVAIGANSRATEENEFSVGLSAGSTSLTRRITHVTDPTNDQDAATKKYVDDKYTTLETTVAGKADTSALANYATKTELAAKADQTAVDAKVSSVTAGEGISITGTATEPVISATGGITDTGWMEITGSSGSGLKYLTGPWTIPVAAKVKIRKFGKRVTVVGIVQATEDISSGAATPLLSIPESDPHFDAFSLPQVSQYDIAHDQQKSAATSALLIRGMLTSFNVEQSLDTPKINVTLVPVVGIAGQAAQIGNGDTVNFQISWDTED